MYLNLVLDYVPETVYRVARHYSRAKQTLPMVYVKVGSVCIGVLHHHMTGIIPSNLHTCEGNIQLYTTSCFHYITKKTQTTLLIPFQAFLELLNFSLSESLLFLIISDPQVLVNVVLTCTCFLCLVVHVPAVQESGLHPFIWDLPSRHQAPKSAAGSRDRCSETLRLWQVRSYFITTSEGDGLRKNGHVWISLAKQD